MQIEEGEVGVGAGGDDWMLSTIRDRGSVHSDVWRGTAADLAGRDAVGGIAAVDAEAPGRGSWF